MSACVSRNRCVNSYYMFAEKTLVTDVLKLSPALRVFMCVHLPSLEVFHEVAASTLGSWGNSDPVNRGNGEDY